MQLPTTPEPASRGSSAQTAGKPSRPRLSVDRVSHRYGTSAVLDGIDLHVQPGEFLTFLGPSGCGKTTLLRIIAGFLRPTEGSVWLHGTEVTNQPAHKRAVNLVFQRPTLFPHLDVFQNVAFGLTLRKTPKAETTQRVEEALALVRLDGYGSRRAGELSGGQMQRVAMARALVNRPEVLLLDEPLSALDLKIRLEMEAELRRVHRDTGTTIVYVTHDQREALALSDRIAIFCQGRLEQVGTPEEIYRRPASPFAARFVGDANVLDVDIADVTQTSGTVELPDGRIEVDGDALTAGSALLVVRPEALRLGEAGPDEGSIRGTVVDVSYRGTGFGFRLAVPGFDESLKIETTTNASAPAVGAEVDVVVDPAQCLLLSSEPRGPHDR